MERRGFAESYNGSMPNEMWTKYSRQILFSGIGEEGQRRLLESRVAIVGCGALGSAQAGALARAGVGFIRIIDRDFVEESNLQRQMLFDEADARESLPKAVAAARKLRRINSAIRVEGVVADGGGERGNALSDCGCFWTAPTTSKRGGCSRCRHRTGVPGYGAVVASYGVTIRCSEMTACLTCLWSPRQSAAQRDLRRSASSIPR
jgi:adenylyltransferase/sulfurtransferase